MVFVCDRRAEECEYTVAHRLHDVAFVMPHRFNHELERGVYNRPGLFRVEVLHQLSRASDIGEERGDSFALAVYHLRRGNISTESNTTAVSRCGC